MVDTPPGHSEHEDEETLSRLMKDQEKSSYAMSACVFYREKIGAVQKDFQLTSVVTVPQSQVGSDQLKNPVNSLWV